MRAGRDAAVTGLFTVLPTSSVRVRSLLLDNAAKYWRASRTELVVGPSVVIRAQSGRRLGHGEIAVFAELSPVAPGINAKDLKKAEETPLIARDVIPVELPSKINRRAEYAIELKVSGVISGTILHGVVEGGEPDKVEEDHAFMRVSDVPEIHVEPLPAMNRRPASAGCR